MSNVNIKTRVYSGQGAMHALEKLKNKNILIVCDSFLVESGAINFCLDAIDKSNRTEVFSDTVPDPSTEVVAKGIAVAAKLKPQIIIGFGGGSAIDTAKAVLYFGQAGNLFKKEKFITIPTTSGTGSEVTSAAVITDREDKSKILIDEEEILADVAILDARLTLSVPPAITANTGMDVLTHAIEAYVAKNANVFSDALAEKAVELTIQSLLTCYCDGKDMEARTNMHEASTLAGMAFNTAGLGMNHSIAHQLGGTFHIPHGLANAILLQEVIKFNCQSREATAKYAKLARKSQMASEKDSDEYAVKILCSVIDQMMESMKMAKSVSQCGIEKAEYQSQLRRMAENARKDRCAPTTPCAFCQENVVEILNKVYE